jgi:hypothetical protein
MAQENFLINPPKRLRRKRSRSRNPMGETLVTIGANPMASNPWYGNSAGHRRAALIRWGKVRRRKRGGVKVAHRSKHRKRGRRWAPKAVRLHRKLAKQAFWHDKWGEILAHPRRKRYKYKTKGLGYYMKRTRRHSNRKRRRNTWYKQPRRHRKAARKGWRIGHMVPFHHTRSSKRRRVRHGNPMTATANPRRRHRNRRRHYNVHRRRRNPFGIGGGMVGKFTGTIMDVRHWAPLAITGGLSAITGAVVPGMLGVFNPYAKYGVQIGVAVGGGMIVERVAGREHGQAWMIVGMAMVGYQLLKEYVLMPYFPQFAVGLGAQPGVYEDFYPGSNAMDVSQRIDAFPNLSAFPSGISAYPGVGDAGAYPYDGAGY